MSNTTLEYPMLIDDYCVKKTQLSSCLCRWDYSYRDTRAWIHACQPYPGIHLWANEVFMHTLPVGELEDYHYIKLNYCVQGRCEVSLPGDRYVYLESTLLSLDANPPMNFFLYPTSRYQGLEVIFDLKTLRQEPAIQAFDDCGIDIDKLSASLTDADGSFLGVAEPEWERAALRTINLLQSEAGVLHDYRFCILELLYLLQHGKIQRLKEAPYLTKGQKAIVTEVERILTQDLSRHITIDHLARQHGISPSSLKKYFTQIYGMPISKYLRAQRMELACRLLRETKQSISDIAAAAGYSNQGKFGSAFKAHTGKTPLEYRRLQYERRTRT